MLFSANKWEESAEALYTLPDSIAQKFDRIHSSVFQETRYRQTMVLLQSATQPTAKTENELANRLTYPNVLTRENIAAIAQLDHLVKGDILDPKTGARVAFTITEPSGAETLNVSKSYPPVRTYKDLCSPDPAGNGCTPTSAGLLDLLLSVAALDSSNHATIPIELPMVDKFLIDLPRRRLIPADVYLGDIVTRPCVRPVPQKLLNDLTLRIIPNYTLRNDRITFDVSRSQVSIDCVTEASGSLLSQDDTSFKKLCSVLPCFNFQRCCSHTI